MENIIKNAKNLRYFIASFVGVSAVYQLWAGKILKDLEVFGFDGNGGKMLRISTDLNDYEIAKLKFQKRLNWHANQYQKPDFGHEPISDEELNGLGIKVKPEPYIEYLKKPPHDKYL